MGSTTWRGMLAPLDVPTGDGRRFLSSGVTNRPLPLPLKWQRTDSGGHDDSVTVGAIEAITICTVGEAISQGLVSTDTVAASGLADDLLAVWGSGTVFTDVDAESTRQLAEDAAEAMVLLTKKVVGPSVDPGACSAIITLAGCDEELTDEQWDLYLYSEEEIDLEILFTEYEIAAATLVGIPAFAECRPFETGPEAEAVTAAVHRDGWDAMPLAARDTSWSGSDADQRVADWAGIGGENPDWTRYGSAFLWVDDSADPETKGAYGFQIADLVDDSLTIVPAAVFAAAAVLQGARGGTNAPQADQDAMKEVLGGIYRRMAQEFDDDGIVVPWDDTAALVAAVSTVAAAYDLAAFADPHLTQVTPITVTDDGRVFGHIATHDVCHVGIPGICKTAPVQSDFGMFHRYQLSGIDGGVGRITVGHGGHTCSCPKCRGTNDDHACVSLTAGAAISHHDALHTVAWVRAFEDQANNAIVVAGVVSTEATIDDLAVLARQRVSGDWRSLGRGHELIEVLALSREHPGFPLPRVRMDRDRAMALTAAGFVAPTRPGPERTTVDIDWDRLASIVEAAVSRRMSEANMSDTVLPESDSGPSRDEVAALLGDIDGCVAEQLAREIGDV